MAKNKKDKTTKKSVSPMSMLFIVLFLLSSMVTGTDGIQEDNPFEIKGYIEFELDIPVGNGFFVQGVGLAGLLFI